MTACAACILATNRVNPRTPAEALEHVRVGASLPGYALPAAFAFVAARQQVLRGPGEWACERRDLLEHLEHPRASCALAITRLLLQAF